MRKELLLGMRAFRHVGILCKACSTEIILDLESRYKPDGAGDAFTPDSCPTCDAPFDSAIKPGLDRLKAVYASLMKLDTVKFHVPLIDKDFDRGFGAPQIRERGENLGG